MTNAPQPDAPKPNRRALLLGLQLVGFIIGLGILVWCGKLAFSEDNREALSQLGQAPPSLVLSLILLTALCVILDGLTIWLVLRPVRKIQLTGMLATNALATFLSYLPFKLSVMTRVAIHRKRDGVPLAIIGPWFAAVGAVMLVSIAPVVLLAVSREKVDIIWFGLLAAMLLTEAVMLCVTARTLGGQRGLRLIQSIADRQPIGIIKKITRTETFALLDEGLAMLADFKNTLAAIGLRIIFIASMAGRFFIASRIVGTPMPIDESLIGSTAYFIIGIVSPVGALGAREGGTAGILQWFGEFDLNHFILITVVVTGAELITYLVLAAAGIAWLRPDKLIRGNAASDLQSSDENRTSQPESDDR